MQYFGDYNKGETVRIPFNTSGADGASITIATNGTPKAYVDGSTTEITTGVTLTEDQDAITGRHFIVVDTTGSGFTIGSDVDVAIDANTIDGKTVNAWVGKFSLNKKTALTPVVGLAQAGAAGSITLPASASSTNDLYKGAIITVVYGTGAGQSRLCTGYVGSTKVASVDPNWAVTPDTTSAHVVTATAPSPATALPDVNTKTIGGQTASAAGTVTFPNATLASTTNITSATVDVTKWNGSAVATPDTAGYPKITIKNGTGTGELDFTSGVVKANLAQILGTALTETAGQIAAAFRQFFNIASPTSTMNTITAVTTVNGLASNVITAAAINTGAITNAKFAAGAIDATAIATDAITAAKLAADAGAEIADAVWDEVLSGHTTAGTAGKGLIDSSSAGNPWSTDLVSGYTGTQAGNILNAVKAKTDQLAFSTANQVDAQVKSMAANTVTASAVATDAVTELQSGLATASALSTAQSDLTTIKGAVDTEVAAILAAVDTEVAAIKAKTDQLTFTVSNQVDANMQSINDATVTGNGVSPKFGV